MTTDELEPRSPARRAARRRRRAGARGGDGGEIVDRPGALPLLQYTLTELFDARRGGRITDAAYRGARRRVAGAGEAGRLAARRARRRGHERARHVFLRLVNLDERAPATLAGGSSGEVEELGDRRGAPRVLDTFGRHRLLSFDRDPVTRGPTVEISHEALLTEWTPLRGWIDDARDDVRNQRRLADAMREWDAADRAEDPAPRWPTRTVAWLGDDLVVPAVRPEQAFLDASVAARDRAASRTRTGATPRPIPNSGSAAVPIRPSSSHRDRIVAALAVFAGMQWRPGTPAKGARQQMSRRHMKRNVLAATVSPDRSPRNHHPVIALPVVGDGGGPVVTADQGYAVPQRAIDATHWALQELGVQYDVESTKPRWLSDPDPGASSACTPCRRERVGAAR